MSKQEGFMCEFTKVLEELFETKCPICNKVLREPYQADCCGKSYCRLCIERHKSNLQPCLECESKAFNLFHNKGLQKTIYGLSVYCTYKNEGCDWTGELKELDNHLNTHPQASKVLDGCEFVAINCPMSFAGCQVSLQRKDMKDHLTESGTAINHQLQGAEIQHYTHDKIEHIEQQLQSLLEEMKRMKIGMRELEGDKQYLQQQNIELESRVKKLEERHELATRVGMAIGPVRFAMKNFMEYKHTNENWFSPPFYTHPQGYKVCLCVVANGEGPLYGKYTSVLLHTMKGDFDSYLKWPLRAAISVLLIDQEGEEKHHIKKLEFTDRTPDDVASRVTEGERAKFGWGLFQYIEHDKLEPRYLKNDCLCFQIGQIELK
jgi:TNF receptor-associated factor 4